MAPMSSRARPDSRMALRATAVADETMVVPVGQNRRSSTPESAIKPAAGIFRRSSVGLRRSRIEALETTQDGISYAIDSR